MSRLMVIPLVLAFILMTLLFFGLQHEPGARIIQTPERAFPAFSLPQLNQSQTLITEKLFKDQFFLVNVWASWCTVCRAEHAFLLELAQEKQIQLIGINYRDQLTDANRYLAEFHSPYRTIIVDQQGELAKQLGVYATPDTFLVAPNGHIIERHTGLLDRTIWQTRFLPKIRGL